MAESPNPKYDLQNSYLRHQDGCEDGKCNDKDECGCCPPGLVAVVNSCGEHLGCLTPNDAEHYSNSLKQCPEGYVKAIHPVTGEYIGCVTPADYISIMNVINV